MEVKKSVLELIGNTPMLEPLNYVNSWKKETGEEIYARIFTKLEYLNPAGSIKDRVVYEMILDAEEKGILQKGATIIEPTSGNTGIGLAVIGASRGYQVILTLPDTMSRERCTLLAAYGAKLILTDGKLGMSGAIAKANELKESIPGSVILGQFENEANPLAHRKSTGPEILRQMDGKVDVLVAGVGTGGTITGIGSYLKEQNPNLKVIAIEPASSPVLSEGKSGAHGIQGIGAGFVPSILDRDLLDEVLPVTENQSYVEARRLAKEEGILVGISAGAALYGAMEIAKRKEFQGANIVVILPDSGDRYLSTQLFA
ncbi:MAG: cysteine synthase A [Lachnospiraceae bacterium]|nr:cysteine synthase A [Lachnospiraceae bacterium]